MALIVVKAGDIISKGGIALPVLTVVKSVESVTKKNIATVTTSKEVFSINEDTTVLSHVTSSGVSDYIVSK
jgi:hypothetical protein